MVSVGCGGGGGISCGAEVVVQVFSKKILLCLVYLFSSSFFSSKYILNFLTSKN